MPSTRTLEAVSGEFADELSQTFKRVLGSHVPDFTVEVSAQESTSGDSIPARVSVTPMDEVGIPISIGGSSALTLYCYYYCEWDHERTFLKVSKSGFEVRAQDDATALFRYEFQEKYGKRLPKAHLHVHAHRDEMLFAMLRGEQKRSRQRREAAVGESDRARPRLSEIHFPLGGTRMRPCIEDVLQLLVQEFGIDVEPNAQKAINAGRRKWRERQVASLVRDAPDVAATALLRLGYRVVQPDGGHPDRRQDLLEDI